MKGMKGINKKKNEQQQNKKKITVVRIIMTGR